MVGTVDPRSAKRAQRWIDQSKAGTWVSDAAFVLLARRLDARWRTLPWSLPIAAVGLFVAATAIANSRSQGTVAGDKAYAARVLLGYAVVCLATILSGVLTNNAERRIGRSLTHRVSRGIAVTIPMMLGRARTVCLGAALVVEIALAVTLLAIGAGWFAWAFAAAVVFAASFVALRLRQAANRPAVAVDPASLAIDERLRSQDAFGAVIVLCLLLLPFPSGGFTHSPGWLQLMWLLASVLVAVLFVLGSIQAPWGFVFSGGHGATASRLRPEQR